MFGDILWHLVLITGPDVKKGEAQESDDDSDLEMIDVDLSIDVNKMDSSQVRMVFYFSLLIKGKAKRA